MSVSSSDLLVVRLKGGLGNQLFEYAAARRLALTNDVELALDCHSGFLRDKQYRRRFELGAFTLPCREARPRERFEPFERERRAIARWSSRRQAYVDRTYIEQEFIGFDPRLLAMRISGRCTIDGLWQSERYFGDIAHIVRADLQFRRDAVGENARLQDAIKREPNAVALHFRDFDRVGCGGLNNVDAVYYERACEHVVSQVRDPHFFVFTDAATPRRMPPITTAYPVTFVGPNRSEQSACEDFRLMSSCRHFITANSTYSWWAAWLGEADGSIVVTPHFAASGTVTAWGFDGLIPERWLTL